MASEEDAPRQPPSRVVKTLGAMTGGVVEACTLQPLDVLKTRLQLGGHSGLVPLARSMLATEGPLAFYKGLTPFCTHLVTKYSVRWYFNELFRSALRSADGTVSTTNGFLAGLGSGVTEAVLIVTPFEVLKTRLQQQKGTDVSKLKYKGPVHTARTIIQEEGTTALWKGNCPTMVRQGVNQLFLFGTYDAMKKAFFGLEREDPIQPSQSLMIGVIAGAMGPLFNNPIDVVKTRLMAQQTIHGMQPKYTGLMQCLTTIYREEGGKALMRGCMMRIVRVAPGMGITFTVVEKFSQWFG